MPLLSEINTPSIERRVLRAARYQLGRRRRYQADYEHGQWWITDLDTGAQWSVVDCQTPEGIDYLGFEQVTEGEPKDEPPMCENCWQPTTRSCSRCGQRICRACATNHHTRDYNAPAELQDVRPCKARGW